MSPSATVYSFEIALSDVNRSVYEELSLKIAQHPSETLDYLITRVLAFCMEYEDGISFSQGLNDPDVPALWIHDLTQTITHWIEVGAPSAERLHKASKKVPRVSIYTYKDPTLILHNVEGDLIHRKEEILLFSFSRSFLEEVAHTTQKRNCWSVSVNEDQLYLGINGQTICGTVGKTRLS